LLEVMHPVLCLQEKAAAVCRREQRGDDEVSRRITEPGEFFVRNRSEGAYYSDLKDRRGPSHVVEGLSDW
jgi:hypothetical protein